jgi:hypothetical protein
MFCAQLELELSRYTSPPKQLFYAAQDEAQAGLLDMDVLSSAERGYQTRGGAATRPDTAYAKAECWARSAVCVVLILSRSRGRSPKALPPLTL